MIWATKTGWSFLVIAVFFYIAAITSQSGLLLTLTGILGSCYLINGYAARRAITGIEVEPPDAVVVMEGQRINQPWRIANRRAQAAGFLELRSRAGSLGRIASLRPGETVSLVPQLVFEKRGVFLNERARLSSTFPFGLITATRHLNLPGEVIVCPAVYPAEPPLASGYDVMVGGKHRGLRRTTSGSDFAGVRPLQPGDPLKQVHWKSSAKGLGMMVKTYEEELSGRVAIIIAGNAAEPAGRYDDAVRCAGSLMFAALDAGHHVEWVEAGQGIHHVVPPFADAQELLEDLARLEWRKLDNAAAGLRQAAGLLSARSAINFVLTEIDEVILGEISQQIQRGRRVSIYLPPESSHFFLTRGAVDFPVSYFTAREVVLAKT